MLPLCSRTCQALWRHLSSRRTTRETDPLFTTRTGQPMDRNHIRQTLQRIDVRAGVAGVRLHRFRYTFAIQFLGNGGTVFALQRLLGHSSPDMVERYIALAQIDVEGAHRDASPVAIWLL